MRIVLCYPVGSRHVEQIRAAAPEAEVIDAGQQRIAQEILDADIFCGHAKVSVPWSQVVDQGRLKWIQSSAAGLDHCLVPEVISSSILVSSSSGVFANQVAEQTIALLLSLIRRIPTFVHAQTEKVFERRPTGDLFGKTVGIVGLGGNGRRIAEVLSAFGVNVLATDAFPVDCPRNVQQLWPADHLIDLLQTVDIVVLCVPLNDRTHHMIGRKELDNMKPGSILINVARGPVVDEASLVLALQSRRLAAAGLDVTEVEPLPPSSPLWGEPNVLITPHVGAQSLRRVDDSTALFCQNLKRFFAQQTVINLVDKQLGFPLPQNRFRNASGHRKVD